MRRTSQGLLKKIAGTAEEQATAVASSSSSRIAMLVLVR
jgi:hypothetical protein